MATEHIGGAFSAELPWMQLRACAGLGSASFDSFPVKELWADCVSSLHPVKIKHSIQRRRERPKVYQNELSDRKRCWNQFRKLMIKGEKINSGWPLWGKGGKRMGDRNKSVLLMYCRQRDNYLINYPGWSIHCARSHPIFQQETVLWIHAWVRQN